MVESRGDSCSPIIGGDLRSGAASERKGWLANRDSWSPSSRAGRCGHRLSAIDTEAEVRRNRYKSREYLRLWRDIWDYLLLGFPSGTIPEARMQLNKFSSQYAEIGLEAQDLSTAAPGGEH